MSNKKERGIMFSPEMIQAILDGRKTQTRREIKPQPEDNSELFGWTVPKYHQVVFGFDDEIHSIHENKYGKVGDHLYIEETDPKIWLEIIDIRVERLQDINRADAKSEGISTFWNRQGYSVCGVPNLIEPKLNQTWTYIEAFKHLWIKIKGQQSWDANPWVWVIEFKRINNG